MGTLGLLAVLFAVLAMDRGPRVSSVQAQEAVACTPIVLDGDAIEPVSESVTASLPTATPSIDHTHAYDPEALAELKRREPMSLSAEEVEALSIFLEQRARANTEKVIGAIANKPRLTAADEATFLNHASNPQTYREALSQMAQHESWQGPDLIYAAMKRNRSNKEISDFALALLLTHRTYKYASPALTVVIDAETLTECEDIRSLVERTRDEGDNRAVSHLAKFAKRTGCGADGKSDCYPCLREDDAFRDALRAAQGRMPPAF